MLELLDLRQALMRAYDHCLAPVQEASGLNRMELDVLLFLANNPAYDTAADMVRRRGLSKSHVSATVERLVQRGLLTRGADPADRRTVHLLPTSAAQEAIAQGRAAQEEIGRWMLRGISAEDQAALSRVLTQMLDNLRDFQSCRP